MDHGLGLIVNNITGYGRTAKVVKPNSHAVEDANENSLPRFKHRSLKPAQCETIRAVEMALRNPRYHCNN